MLWLQRLHGTPFSKAVCGRHILRVWCSPLLSAAGVTVHAAIGYSCCGRSVGTNSRTALLQQLLL